MRNGGKKEAQIWYAVQEERGTSNHHFIFFIFSKNVNFRIVLEIQRTYPIKACLDVLMLNTYFLGLTKF
jgi:hypothetical protein